MTLTQELKKSQDNDNEQKEVIDAEEHIPMNAEYVGGGNLKSRKEVELEDFKKDADPMGTVDDTLINEEVVQVRDMGNKKHITMGYLDKSYKELNENENYANQKSHLQLRLKNL